MDTALKYIRYFEAIGCFAVAGYVAFEPVFTGPEDEPLAGGVRIAIVVVCLLVGWWRWSQAREHGRDARGD